MSKSKPRQLDAELGRILQWLTDRQNEMIASVREMVVRESPTHDKPACDNLCSHLASEFECLGGKIQIHPQPTAGNHLQVNFAGASSRKPVLLLGHFDTVHDLGTLQEMPWRQQPGTALRARSFRHEGRHRADDVCPVGATRKCWRTAAARHRIAGFGRRGRQREFAPNHRKACQALRRGAGVRAFRPGRRVEDRAQGRRRIHTEGDRTGGTFRTRLRERPQRNTRAGASSPALSGLTDLKRGITLNVGVIRGGTRTNVVAAEAMAEVDLRVARKSDGAVMERKVRQLRAVNPKCTLHIEGGINRPPLERTKQVAALFELAREVGRELGLKLQRDCGWRRFGRQLHRRHRHSDAGRIGRGRRWSARRSRARHCF